MYKLFFTLAILTITISSCGQSTSQTDQTGSKDKVTRENVFDKIVSVVNHTTEFEEISVTYDNLIDEFSPNFKKSFIKDGGDMFKNLLPKWRTETNQTIAECCSSNDAQLINHRMTLDKNDKELKGYSGELTFNCGDSIKTIRFSAFETATNFYVTRIR